MRARWNIASLLLEETAATASGNAEPEPDGLNRLGAEHGVETEHGANTQPLQSMVVPSRRAAVFGAESISELHDPTITSDILRRLRGHAQIVELHQYDSVLLAKVLDGSSDDLALEIIRSQAVIDGVTARLRARLYDVFFLIEGQLQGSESGWRLVGPFRIYCVNRRFTARVSMAPHEGRFLWPTVSDGDVSLAEVPLHDFSIDGVGVEVTNGTALESRDSFPGLIDLDGNEILCLAHVKRQKRGGSATHYGLRLQVTGSRQLLVDSYLRRRFPRLIERASVESRVVLELLEKSGYTNLRAETRPPEKWFALPSSKQISRDICYRADDGAVIGHISATRAYSRAWLGHQIATLKDHAESVRCRRDIYLHIAAFATLMDGEDTVMYGYFDRSKKWHGLFFHDFVRWVDDPSLAVIAELDRFERAEPGRAPRPAPVLPEGVEVAEPEPEELVLATGLIRSQLPPLVSDTLDVHPGQLQSEYLHDAYRGGLYRRARRVLVLRSRGRLAGVALCEIGSRELTLFNIFNMAFFFFVEGPAAPTTDAQLALLGRVRALYAEHGEHNPMVVAPPRTFAATSEPGTILAETMGLIAKSGRSLRQYESFIRYRFGSYLDA